jgi:hypothetical protein
VGAGLAEQRLQVPPAALTEVSGTNLTYPEQRSAAML